MSELLFETTGGIATITLNRPDSGNAFTTEMLEAWERALRECIRDDAIRAVVLTGAGRIFCSGGDVKRMAKNAAGGQTAWERGQYLVDHVHRIPLTLQELDKPYIVAVNGAATGAGMDMALMGDLRFAAQSARFAESYIKVGFVAGDGGAWMLPRLVGTPKALEMLWLGDFVGAEEAERIGLVNKMVPDDQLMAHTMAVAERLANGPTVAIRLMKRMVRQGAQSSFPEALTYAAACVGVVSGTEDYREATAAFAEKRKPAFKGR
ncbi:enoyl-CoA hydratase/isomerase family protein [Paracraurococcus ruber]|uniref:Enoyl-CoA hydratase n=1 Tax=Paracraurococcus ruber TaxID=77675 RepID=A0ABS1CZ02_9PROT|nr:enoyl-CoA hydratase-related protein [Paracraurococcus ruber]MBK1659638.1 enoyl-CoA hydratase [Paracraurococcus ruber]TDG29301.1 enoyl-CoA hydratase [Paracraurococcus ruber]